MKSWGAPPKSLGVRIGNGATRRLAIYAFDPSVSQHVIFWQQIDGFVTVKRSAPQFIHAHIALLEKVDRMRGL